MTVTFSETPPVYSVTRTEQPVNTGYPSQMRKFHVLIFFLLFNFCLGLIINEI